MAVQLLSDEDVGFGQEKPTKPLSLIPAAEAAPSAAPSGLLSDEAVGFSREKAESPYAPSFDKTMKGLKAVGGEAGALADFFLSVPGFIVQTGAQIGGTIQAAARGVPLNADPRQLNPVTAYTVGREAGKEFGEPLMNPVKKVLDLFRSGEAYEKSKTTAGLTKLAEMIERAGKWAEETSGGQISRDAVPMLVDTLMASASGVGGGKKGTGIDPIAQKRIRESAVKLREQAEADAKARTLTPEEFTARAPVQQQINDLLGIRTPAEEAARTRAKRKDVNQAFKAPEEGGDYGSISESQFRADERMSNEAEYAKQAEASRIGGEPVDVGELRNQRAEAEHGQPTSADVLRVMQKPGFDRSATDLLTLRNAKEKGTTDMKTAAGLATAAILTGSAADYAFNPEHREHYNNALKMIGVGGAALAIKQKGGMWHPEAVKRLEAPLSESLVRGADSLEAQQPAIQWSTKAIKNYLNKYAGTEGDPLREVEIPAGRGTEFWGELTDRAVKGFTKEETAMFVGDKPVEGAPYDQLKSGEKLWQLAGEQGSAAEAIQSYLSHVGDYLREHVAPEKLQQYDLVRAVKETAKWDAELAKKMNSVEGRAEGTEPYKTYPDKFQWVEVKSAEALKREGDVMGHCVGGYCGMVENGESRIFSLRDPKGASHVTVEVSPARATDADLQAFRDKEGRRPTRAEETDILRGRGRTADGDIAQIKGKQNRAPNAEYLPYVQDFVKSGKWGEVGDLDNSGLIDMGARKGERYITREAHQAEIDANNNRPGGLTDTTLLRRTTALSRESGGRLAEVTKEDLAAYRAGELEPGAPAYRTIKEAEGLDRPNDWRANQRGTERGFIDQKLIVGMTGLGLGGIAGWAMSDDPSGALLGALAGASLGFPGTWKRLKSIADVADYGLGALSTRIGNISEPLKLRVREFERRNLTQSYEILHKVAPFMSELNKLGDSAQQKIERAILTGDRGEIARLMQGNQPLVAGWRETQNVLKDLGERLQGHGRFRTMLDDYFPRLVKDVEGLKKALDIPERTRLEAVLAAAEKVAIKDRGVPLSEAEQSSIINREVAGFRRAKGYQPGYAKQRGVDEITEKLQPFYHTASESLYAYVRGGVQDLELARFFGRDLMQTEIGKQKHTNIEGSIGNLVGRELSEGKIDHKQAQELIKMLQSRFQGGERSPNRLVQEVRNLGNMGLLGNVVSAITQMSDTAMAIYAQDLRSSVTAIARQISGREKLYARDFGLADHIAEEFVSQTKTAEWLNKIFKYSGFSAIDRFGKNVHIGAAIARGERLSRTEGGMKTLEREYGKAFGSEFSALAADLREGRISERVRAYAFSELSDMQPISKSEMPQAYLDNPNGRLIYMLKTFMLKQMDIVRRDTYNEIKRGNIGKGAKNLTEYALVLGIAGATTQMVQDWIMGRDVHFEATDVMENTLKTFGWGEYVRDKAFAGKPLEAVAGMIVPPYRMMDEIIRRDARAAQYIPLIGKLYYSWELGGRERSEIARKKKTGEELSDEAKDFRREQREKRRAKE